MFGPVPRGARTFLPNLVYLLGWEGWAAPVRTGEYFPTWGTDVSPNFGCSFSESPIVNGPWFNLSCRDFLNVKFYSLPFLCSTILPQSPLLRLGIGEERPLNDYILCSSLFSSEDSVTEGDCVQQTMLNRVKVRRRIIAHLFHR